MPLPPGDLYALSNCPNLHPTLGLPSLPGASIDAIVTDPPAGIAFMGKAWDEDKGGREQWIAWLASVMRECLRVLKPGGHALVWALPRTSHWTATAIEDAGFEVRDVVLHLFGSGFPKSLDVSKAIDKAVGADAARWRGWGTALKPAAEHWILARKPLDGTVAANVLAHGVGALNIDGCRIGASQDDLYYKRPLFTDGRYEKKGLTSIGGSEGAWASGDNSLPSPAGRWPANVTLDEDAAAVLDEQSGTRKSGVPGIRRQPHQTASMGQLGRTGALETGYADTGGASRFFYVAKPSRAEKDAGLDHLPVQGGGAATGRKEGSTALASPRTGAGRTGTARNTHPTVKGVALMRYLCRLITPPGGIILDPFMGSGSTGVAALMEGFRFVGIEQDPAFVDIAVARLDAVV